jgi:hypothetical protein
MATTEIIFTWPDGREEVRYRRPKDSADALSLIETIIDCKNRHGETPYSWRHVDDLKENCPTCGARVASIFDHVDGCPDDMSNIKRTDRHEN